MKTSELIKKVLYNLIPVLIGMSIVIGINRTEMQFFPVVRGFTVTNIQTMDDKLIVSGLMRKVRDCKFAGITVLNDNGDELEMSFRDTPTHNSSRSVGVQTWGPWQVIIPREPKMTAMTFQSVHTCHPFWSTRTTLTTIPALNDSTTIKN